VGISASRIIPQITCTVCFYPSFQYRSYQKTISLLLILHPHLNCRRPTVIFYKRTMIKSIVNGSDEADASRSKNVLETIDGKRDIPQAMDVILGRGKSYGKHPGNMIFQGKRTLLHHSKS
jgi:hypothetical protein